MTPDASPGAAPGSGCNYGQFMVNQTPRFGIKKKKTKPRKKKKNEQ